jgi:hypothetical protein
MPKWLAIFAFAVIVAFVSSQPGKGTPKRQSTGAVGPQGESQDHNQDSHQPPSVVVQVSPQPANSSDSMEEKDTQRKLAVYTCGLMIFTAVLAVVSMAQGYFLRQQANRLREHAGHLQALATSAAVGQRAWVVIRSGMEDMREAYKPNTQEHPYFWWIVKNYGRTPAQIIETQCRYELVKDCFLFNLPESPDYPEPIPLEGTVLVPKEPLYYSTFLRDRTNGLGMIGTFTDSQIRATQEGGLSLLAYGYVKYRDGISEEIRESNFIAHYVWPKPNHQF